MATFVRDDNSAKGYENKEIKQSMKNGHDAGSLGTQPSKFLTITCGRRFDLHAPRVEILKDVVSGLETFGQTCINYSPPRHLRAWFPAAGALSPHASVDRDKVSSDFVGSPRRPHP